MTTYDNILRAIKDELEKCSKPKYIQDLPYDLRTRDSGKLNERLEAIQKLEDETQEEYDKKYEEYEKAKEDEKTSRDKILKVGEDMEHVINGVWEEVTGNMGFDRNSLDSEMFEYEDDETGEIYEEPDEDLIGWYHSFYDSLESARTEFPEFNQALQDRLISGDENAPTYRVRMENLIDDMVNGLDNGPGAYFDRSIENDLKLIQRGIIQTIPTEADKWEKATEKVGQLESELLEIRDKQNTLRGEYDDTIGKLSE